MSSHATDLAVYAKSSIDRAACSACYAILIEGTAPARREMLGLAGGIRLSAAADCSIHCVYLRNRVQNPCRRVLLGACDGVILVWIRTAHVSTRCGKIK